MKDFCTWAIFNDDRLVSKSFDTHEEALQFANVLKSEPDVVTVCIDNFVNIECEVISKVIYTTIKEA